MATKIERRKLASKRKEELIRVRVTKKQKQLLQKAADRNALDLSAWVRMVTVTEARRTD